MTELPEQNSGSKIFLSQTLEESVLLYRENRIILNQPYPKSINPSAIASSEAEKLSKNQNTNASTKRVPPFADC
jgi:hypothetical protein